MAVASERSPPLGIFGIVLLTVVYSGGRWVMIIYGSPEWAFWGGTDGFVAFWGGVAGLVVAYLLVQGHFVGWIAAVVLYTLLSVNLALGAAAFGLRQAPQFVVPLVALAYLLSARDRFHTVPSTASTTGPDRSNCPGCGARNPVTSEKCYYCDEPL